MTRHLQECGPSGYSYRDPTGHYYVPFVDLVTLHVKSELTNRFWDSGTYSTNRRNPEPKEWILYP